MKEHDPPPLGDPGSGAPELLREALAGARARMPSPADLARVAARLPLGAPPPGGSGPAAPPSVLSGALIGAALGAVVSGAALLWDARRAPPPAAPVAVATVPVEAPRRAIEATTPPPALAPRPEITAAPVLPSHTVQVSASVPASAPPVVPAADPAPGAPPELAVVSAGAPAPPDDAESEAHLLQRAHEALGASPAQALALTEAHAGRFPAGSLAQERELLAIQALMRLGRVEEARARAARFVAAFPGSAHRSRIEAMVSP